MRILSSMILVLMLAAPVAFAAEKTDDLLAMFIKEREINLKLEQIQVEAQKLVKERAEIQEKIKKAMPERK